MPYSANRGQSTYYKFQFILPNSIDRNASLSIIFPPEFDLNNFQNPLECYIKTLSAYAKKPCTYTLDNVVTITVESLLNQMTEVIIGRITNPSILKGTG